MNRFPSSWTVDASCKGCGGTLRTLDVDDSTASFRRATTECEDCELRWYLTVTYVLVPASVTEAKGCQHGHRYTEENTYVTADGKRTCVECKRLTRRGAA